MNTQPKESPVNESRKTILIVDDTPENIDILIHTLHHDYKTKAATNGERALKIAQKKPYPDMILLDIMMPEMDGYEVCRILKSSPDTANIPVIFITAMSEEQDQEKGLMLGAVDYITKPISPAITAARVRTHLALYAQKQELEREVESETEKRLVQQKLLLRQSRLAAMGEMISAITHQWKQPLSVISTTSASLHFAVELSTLADEELLRGLDKIEDTVMFMSQTMDDFKNYLKPNKKRERFAVKHEFESVLSMMSSLLNSSHITVTLDIDPEATGYGVPSEFKQVILNLVSNAKDAIKANNTEGGVAGKITITGRNEKETTVIEVEDNGGGIPENAIDHVFDDYFTTKDDHGTGIGLSMSKMIIEEEMHGMISVTNTSSGAKFILKIPAAEPAGEQYAD